MFAGQKILLKSADRNDARKKRVAVIGCGMSGLVSMKTALEDGHDIIGFEKEADIGGMWNYKMYGGDEPYHVIDDPEQYSFPAYKDLLTNTSRYNNAFSDFEPLPPENGGSEFRFMPAEEVCTYMKAYADHFRLMPNIRFNAHVRNVEKVNNKWHVTYEKDGKCTTEIVDHVMVASGAFGFARFSKIEGMSDFKGVLIHSSQLRNGAALFKDKRVVVLGTANSGTEIMKIALSSGVAKIYTCASKRPEMISSWAIEPYTKSVYGDYRPWDYQMTRDTALMTGDFGSMFGEWVYPVHKKSTEDTITYPGDVIGVGDLSTILRAEQNGIVEFIKPVTKFTESSAILLDGTELNNIDIVICATGFEQKFPYLDNIWKREDQIDCRLYNYCLSPDPALDGLVFILQQPGGAGLFTVAEMQARWFVHKIVSRDYGSDGTVFNDAERQHMRDTICVKKSTLKPWLRFNFIDDIPGLVEALAIDIGVDPPDYKELCASGEDEKVELGVALLYGPLVPTQYRIRGKHACPRAVKVVVDLAKRYLGKHFDVYKESVKNNVVPRSGQLDPTKGPWNDYLGEKNLM